MAKALKGGDKLKSYMKDTERKLSTSSELRVGFLETATYPDGTPVAQVAALNEFGVPSNNQPPRPFFRDTIAYGVDNWPKNFFKFMQASNNNVERSMQWLGMKIQGDIQDAIESFDDPANAEATAAKKGFNNPLIDKGTMQRSVDFEVGGDS